MTQEKVSSWMEQYTQNAEYDKKPKFQIKGGESKLVQFMNEGREIDNEYGPTIVFDVVEAGVQKVWFVGKKKYSLLRQIAIGAPLSGKAALITRTGNLQKDTRYEVVFK